MNAAPKMKVSLTLSADLLALVDRDARLHKDTRSGVIEQWLRRAAHARVERDIEDATVAYYAALRADDVAENDAVARSLSRAARRVSYDPPPAQRRRRLAR
jgi:hypothetical protein